MKLTTVSNPSAAQDTIASSPRAVATAFVSHPAFLLHEMGPYHPECPERLSAITDRLIAAGNRSEDGGDPSAAYVETVGGELFVEDREVVREYELAFPGVTMPWLKKHVGIQFTACRDGAGALIPFHGDLPAGHLRPALVVETGLRYVEGDGLDASTLESQVHGLYWSVD